MISLLKYLKPYWVAVTLAMVMLILSTTADLATPTLVERIIDIGIAQKNNQFVLNTTLIMVAVTLASTILSIGNSYYSVQASQNFATDLRKGLFVKIQSLSFQNLDRYQSGTLLVRLTSDNNQVQSVVQLFLRLMTRGPLMMLGSFVLLFITSRQLSVMILVLLPVTMALIVFYTVRSNPLFLKVQRRLDRLNTVMQENLAGVRVVKAFVRGKYEINRFSEANQAQQKQTTQVMVVLSLLNPLLLLCVNLAILSAIWFGGLEVRASGLTIGAVVAFTNYLLLIAFPLQMLGTFASQLTAGQASAQRINEVLNSQASIQNRPDARQLPSLRGEVGFENVSFSYNGENEEAVLHNITFNTRTGEKIAILGATGAGKSTLVYLIPRYYDVTVGKVTLDGVDVRDLDLPWLRGQIGISMQDPILFSGTVRENIAYGKPDASMDEVIAAAKAAQADDFIQVLPDGYDAIIGQRGVNLSGGQKQRLAIARAILIQPKVLILDDSTSAVDVETESRIELALDQQLHDCTRIIIAQRISTVLNADRILVLERGGISGIGTHTQLLQSNPLYREIYSSQLGITLKPLASPPDLAHPTIAFGGGSD
jgi:ATP-binding cassette subfamily B multidrug efflux pump